MSKGKLWPIAIAVVLLGDMLLGFAMIRLASSDPHAAVEPDYYRKAVAWDSTQTQARASAALGWRVTPMIAAVSASGNTVVRLALQDREGDPLDSATVSIEAIPVAHAAESIFLNLPAASPGSYQVAAPLHRAGLWELRIQVIRKAEYFTQILRMETLSDAEARVIAERPGDPLPERVAAGTMR